MSEQHLLSLMQCTSLTCLMVYSLKHEHKIPGTTQGVACLFSAYKPLCLQVCLPKAEFGSEYQHANIRSHEGLPWPAGVASAAFLRPGTLWIKLI